MKDLIVDTRREAMMEQGSLPVSGIFCRAKRVSFLAGQCDSEWASIDMMALDKDSFLEFLRSRGGDNPWAEDIIGIIAKHGHLHKSEITSREGS